MVKRFENCGLTYASEEGGTNIEFTKETVLMYRQDPSKLMPGLDVVFRAIFNQVTPSPEFGALSFERFDLFRFKVFKERSSKAMYEIYRVTSFGGPTEDWCYIYIVLDAIFSRTAGKEDMAMSYELRGISRLMPNHLPEQEWCNSDPNWCFWSDRPINFNEVRIEEIP